MEYQNYDGVDFSYRGNLSMPFIVSQPIPVGYSVAGISEKENKSKGVSPDWARELIQIRGDELIKKCPLLADSFRVSHNLTELARMYVRDDYKISPRTARRIIFYALERLVDKKELVGIDPDPLPKIGFDWNRNKKETRKKSKKHEKSLSTI